MGFVTDPATAVEKIAGWMKKQLRAAGRREYVLGLSGGIDSALSAYLAVRAVGKENLLCLLMPYHTSFPDSLTDAITVADELEVRHRAIEIGSIADAYEKQVPNVTPVRRGNLCARLRMISLFDHSHAHGLVLGTSNKTEVMLGYGTLFGDAACSVNPLGDLYKTDVRTLARHLKLPESIQRKIPTADLWHGQTDEGELGHSYDEIDRLLVKIVDEQKTRRQILAEGTDPKFLERVVSLIRGSSFKRRLAPVAWLDRPYTVEHIEEPAW